MNLIYEAFLNQSELVMIVLTLVLVILTLVSGVVLLRSSADILNLVFYKYALSLHAFVFLIEVISIFFVRSLLQVKTFYFRGETGNIASFLEASEKAVQYRTQSHLIMVLLLWALFLIISWLIRNSKTHADKEGGTLL